MKTKYKIIVLLSLSFFYNFQSSIKREREVNGMKKIKKYKFNPFRSFSSYR